MNQSSPALKICPKCKRTNALHAQVCACGHGFSTQFVDSPKSFQGGVHIHASGQQMDPISQKMNDWFAAHPKTFLVFLGFCALLTLFGLVMAMIVPFKF